MSKSDRYTVGDLADACGAKSHQVAYIIRKLKITPVQRAGFYRLFDQASLAKIRSELASRPRLRGGPVEGGAR